MTLRRLIALFVAAWVMVPALAGVRPACCTKPAAKARHACCAAAPAMASAAKGCCKPPVAPKPEARGKEATAGALVPIAQALPIARTGLLERLAATAFRSARLDHRAASPEDTPPDLLSLHHTLLI